MFKVNDNYLKLPGSYLFSTIGKKVNAYSAAHPDKKIIRLGIGDVTQPLAPAIIDALHGAVDEMVTLPTLAMSSCAMRSPKMIIRQEAAILHRTRFLYPTEQNVTVAIFRRSSAWTIRSRYVIRYTRYTWIPMSWQAEPALTIRSPRPGVM